VEHRYEKVHEGSREERRDNSCKGTPDNHEEFIYSKK